MADTVPMIRESDCKTADVHPAEVTNWKRAGWRVVERGKQPEPTPAPKRGRKAKG